MPEQEAVPLLKEQERRELAESYRNLDAPSTRSAIKTTIPTSNYRCYLLRLIYIILELNTDIRDHSKEMTLEGFRSGFYFLKNDFFFLSIVRWSK